jgi:hypothetical protein
MSDLGGMLFDRDAVYIDLPDWKVRATHVFALVPGFIRSGFTVLATCLGFWGFVRLLGCTLSDQDWLIHMRP